MICECFFCEERRFELNEKIGVASIDSIIYQDENVFITPDIAPVMEGHFLIVTKVHRNSFANTDDDTYLSLEKAKEFLRINVFGGKKILFFEHGAVRENTAGSCIDHAHMHVIPILFDIDIDGFIDAFVSSKKVKANKRSIMKCAKEGQPYIFYEIDKDNAWYYPVEKLPHQFFRMMVSYRFSITHYRWGEQYKTDQSIEIFKNTLTLGIEGIKDKH